MSRFKGLDLVDRVPEELWTEVCNIVQEVVTKTIPKKKKRKKAKWLSEEALHIAEDKKRSKRQGRMQLNTEFQRIVRRVKKSLVNNAKKERKAIELGKTRDLFKKIRDTKVTFHAKIGTIKDRNGKKLVKAMILPVVMYRCESWTIQKAGNLVAKLCLTFVTPWTLACQAPQSVGFSRQEFWSGLPFPSSQKAEHQRIDDFELWCWRRLLRVPWRLSQGDQTSQF